MLLTMARDFNKEDTKEDTTGDSSKGGIYFSIWLYISLFFVHELYLGIQRRPKCLWS